MRLPLTLAAVLLSALFAGCIGGPGQTMTARDGLDDARATAESWAEGEDLELLGVVAVEPFKHFRYESEERDEDGRDEDDEEEDEREDRDEEPAYEAEFVTHLDGNPGDGKAPGWAYGFYTGERCITVVLAAGLGVLVEGYETCDDDLDPLPEWSVDSDEVAEILQAHEDWPDLGEDGTYFWGLFNDDGDAVWVVGGTGEDGESVFASVDADSGDVLQVMHEIDGDLEAFFEAEQGSATSVEVRGGSDEDFDSATALTPGDQLRAEVDLDDVGYLAFQFSQTSGVTPHTVTIEGPYGTVDEFEVGPTIGVGSGQSGREYGDLPAGHYTVTLEANTASVLTSISVYAEW